MLEDRFKDLQLFDLWGPLIPFQNLSTKKTIKNRKCVV